MNDFPSLAPAMASALAKRGYETLTPVQQAVIEPHLAGRDVLVSAQTGSGKTVAFGLAIAPTLLDGAERFGRADTPLALVIAPTRELALQVQREIEWLYEPAGAAIASCVGGMDIRTERRALERGAHIVVGTPGRLRDHITRGALDLASIRAVVLDEADEMLDLGFREDLEFILEAAPEDRRTLMFSATVPPAIARLAESYQRDAMRISTAAERSQHVDIDYRAHPVVPSDRENAIINVLRFHDAANAIVFCSTRAAVNHLTARLNNRGFSVVALSGELSQNERSHALQAMRDGRARVCIATDVAARGIDLPGLELVVHADLPSNSETLLHRSGRTGRAGRKGVSALIVPVNARRKAERLLQGARITAQWLLPPAAEDILRRDDERLMADPMLASPVTEDEDALVDQLVSAHGARQVAAALVRTFRAGRSAPEDLTAVSLDERKPRERRDDGAAAAAPLALRPRFGESRWVTLSVGRSQRAEPRWLIPMLCRSAGLTKHAIGAIKMQQEETYVELSPEGAEALLAAAGPKRLLEKGIRLTPIDGTPDLAGQGEARRERFGTDEARDRKPRLDRPAKEKRGYPKRAEGEAAERPAKKAWEKHDAPRDDARPAAKPFRKPFEGRVSDDAAPGGKAFGKGKPFKGKNGSASADGKPAPAGAKKKFRKKANG
ncbi:DEAD/DEAH box helicase [Rhizobium sp. TRM95111]|uniref:DEAD/DEAH box helicase n=1 Tax=Rhizobium alarense TaxID=2846851 RepID=UPI001F36C2DC|nr:DEAD/DEAH box helicase [Rhizobium alarense]MCF3642153.1 DEAD/DEAH box helicase [Rhizobium alarense]